MDTYDPPSTLTEPKTRAQCLGKHIKFKIYRIIILSAVLFGCRTWSPALREERRLSVFENRVLRKKFWPTRDEVTGGGGVVEKTT